MGSSIFFEIVRLRPVFSAALARPMIPKHVLKDLCCGPEFHSGLAQGKLLRQALSFPLSKLARMFRNARSRGLYARVQIPPEEFFDCA